MQGKILECQESFKTARLLATELNIPCGRFIERNEPKYDWIFRYGNTSHLDYYPRVILNKAHNINFVSDKYRCRKKLLIHDVPVPRMFELEDIDNNLFVQYPVIARPKNHFKGRFFYLAKNKDEARLYIEKGYYLQEVIDKKIEYRIFIWQDKIFEVSIKQNDNENISIREELIRNFDNGWRFMFQSVDNTNQYLKDSCRNAMRLTGLDWGAVDCCLATDGNFYIFEINSAPSLIERKISKLANKVRGYIERVLERTEEIGGGIPQPNSEDDDGLVEDLDPPDYNY